MASRRLLAWLRQLLRELAESAAVVGAAQHGIYYNPNPSKESHEPE